MMEGLAGTQDGEGDAEIRDQENAVSHPYADFQMRDSSPAKVCQQKMAIDARHWCAYVNLP
jgi:hypothetical protein